MYKSRVGLSASVTSYFTLAVRLGGLAPTLSLDFLSGSLDSRITFTRGTTATFVGSNGLIQSAAINTPRFDYDPVTLNPKGLLIEEQRSNLVTYSEQFDNAAWTKTNATVTANSATAPDGTSTADSLIENTVNGVHDARRSVTASALTTYTQSIFVKANGRTRGQMQMFGNSGGSTINYDLTAGTATAAGAYGGWTSASATITNFGNGWYRITNTATTNAGLTSLVAAYLLADASGSASYTGDGTSGMLYWGAQLEAGAFATSYIPTVASTVTRSADVASMTGTNFSSWYNQSEGTLLVSASQQTIFAASRTASAISNSGTGSRVGVYRQSAGPINGFVTPGAGALATGVNATANTAWVGAIAYNSTNAYVSVNGSSVASGAHTASLTLFDNLGIGGYASGNENFCGHIRRIAYYPTRLANTTLQRLTA